MYLCCKQDHLQDPYDMHKAETDVELKCSGRCILYYTKL